MIDHAFVLLEQLAAKRMSAVLRKRIHVKKLCNVKKNRVPKL